MGSLILKIAEQYISPVLILVSVLVFFTGHNHPGGGFIGGLLAATAFILACFAHDVNEALLRLRVESRFWMTAGLLTVLASGAIGVLHGKPFLTGKWISFHLKYIGTQHLGSPTLFDFGIYILVIGVVATVISNLAEE